MMTRLLIRRGAGAGERRGVERGAWSVGARVSVPDSESNSVLETGNSELPASSDFGPWTLDFGLSAACHRSTAKTCSTISSGRRFLFQPSSPLAQNLQP